MSCLASVIIPVYNAEKTLERCVESLVFGEERNVEIILVEDCSKDNSWKLCQELAAKYPNIVAVRNDGNRGVSYTRNHGLQMARGEYILFMDSDDWGSRYFAAHLLSAAKDNPEKLVMCGFHFLDRVNDQQTEYVWEHQGKPTPVAPEAYLTLVGKTLIQISCNKVFRLEVIREHGISFDESQSMGEDFQFVLDYMSAAKPRGCVVLNEPLYYYIRANETSLMSKFGQASSQAEEKRFARLWELTGAGEKTREAYETVVHNGREAKIYQIAHSKRHAEEEKLGLIRGIMQDGQEEKHYARHMRVLKKENLAGLPRKARLFLQRVRGRLQRERRALVIKKAQKGLRAKDFTLITQNCIGGVFYHDMGMEFLSPTVNLYFTAGDFIRFASDLKKYLSMPLEMRWEEQYPVGTLGDVEVRFMHFETCAQAEEAWNRRKTRIRWDRIFILTTDMEGFGQAEFEAWKELPYPKLLFTAQRAFAGHEDVVFYPEYEKLGSVPDLIPGREFYKGNVLIDAINRL